MVLFCQGESGGNCVNVHLVAQLTLTKPVTMITHHTQIEHCMWQSFLVNTKVSSGKHTTTGLLNHSRTFMSIVLLSALSLLQAGHILTLDTWKKSITMSGWPYNLRPIYTPLTQAPYHILTINSQVSRATLPNISQKVFSMVFLEGNTKESVKNKDWKTVLLGLGPATLSSFQKDQP